MEKVLGMDSAMDLHLATEKAMEMKMRLIDPNQGSGYMLELSLEGQSLAVSGVLFSWTFYSHIGIIIVFPL